MKRMRDYTKWSTDALREKSDYHRAVVQRLSNGGFPHRANAILLREIESILATREGAQA